MKYLIVFLALCTLILTSCNAPASPAALTDTPLPFSTFTPSPSPTITSTFTPVPTSTPTLTPTPTATPLPAIMTTPIASMRRAQFSPWQLIEFGAFEVSPDGRHVAYADISGDKIVVKMNGTTSKGYADLMTGGIHFSPDSQHWFMIAFLNEDEFVVVADGVEGPVANGRISSMSPDYSADSQHLYYGVMVDDKAVFVYDGVAGKPYDEMNGWMWISENNDHYAYLAREGETWMVVVDEVESAAFDQIEPYSAEFSKDGLDHLVYEARRGDQWYLVNGDQEIGPYDDIDHGFLLSADGQQVLFAARIGSQAYAITNGTASEAYDEILRIGYDDTELHLYYVARSGEEIFYVIDGLKYGPFLPSEQEPYYYYAVNFSSDGQRMAYLARLPEGEQIVVDGQEGALYDKILYHEFSQDGQRFTFSAAQDGQAFIYVDEDMYGPYPAGSFDWYGQFSEDGAHVWYQYSLETDGLEYLGIDGVTSTGYEEIELPSLGGPVFSPDGNHWAYVAQKGEGAYVLVVDGNESQVFEDLFISVVFRADSQQFAFVAKEDGDDSWQVYTWSLTDGSIVEQGESYDKVKDISYSPEGVLVYVAGKYVRAPENQFERLAYPIQDGDQWFVVVNGQVREEYEIVYFFAESAFEEPGRVHYLAFDGEVWLVVNQTLSD